MRSSWLLVFALATTACATDDSVDTDDVDAPDDDGKADAASELSVRASETTLWIDRALERRGDLLVLHGRTSRNITSGNAFIFDDVYGDFVQNSPRTFEVSWPVSTAHGVVDGINLFSSIGFKHSSSAPDNLTSRVVVRPRLGAFTGPSSMMFTAELTPVVVAGRTVYRVQGRSTKAISAVRASGFTARLVDATHFEVDVDFDQLMGLLEGSPLEVTATLPTGPATKRATLALSVKKVGLTSRDVYDVYPVPTCTAAVKSCLLGLADGAVDLAACGEAIKTRVCQGQVGIVVDDASVDAARASADARVADPAGFATDAVGIIGSERATMLRAALGQQIAGRLDDLRHVWLLTPTARTAVLGLAVESAFDRAYAHPFELVPQLPPVAGDLARTRQVVADALLQYLERQDYVNSEFGRSYDELTREFRAQHVQSLREFRETAVPETIGSTPNVDYYIGQWLGAHTEMTVDHTNGWVTNVLVELD